MTDERAEQIRVIFQQGRQAAKDFIDAVFDLSEKLFCIFVEKSSDKPVIENSNSPKSIMNKKELANFLGISVRHLCDLQNEGLPVMRLGESIRFDVEEVLTWAKGKKIKVQKTKLRVVR